MRHRALGLGGQLQVGPRPGGGTQIEVRLPLAQILAAALPAGASAAAQ
jgi:signal transduction histidine kinase